MSYDLLDHAENIAPCSAIAVIELPQEESNRRLASVEARASGDYLLWLG